MVAFAYFFDFQFVRMGNFWYFFFWLLLVGLFFYTNHLCKRKGKKFTDRFVLILICLNFALHIFKQFLPRYRAEWPDGWADSLFPNLCAALIFLSPFIYLWGPKPFKDYMYYLGVISGLAVFFFPTGAMRYEEFPGGFSSAEYVFETIRFYLCHTILILAGYLMVAHGSHKLSYKRIKFVPLVFGFFFLVVGLHAIIWGPIAKLAKYPHQWVGEDGVFNNRSLGQLIANQSMVFGPQPGLDKVLRPIAERIFIPGLMSYWVDGELYYTPILWASPALLLAIAIVGPLMTYPFDSFAMRRAYEGYKQKRKLAREARREE